MAFVISDTERTLWCVQIYGLTVALWFHERECWAALMRLEACPCRQGISNVSLGFLICTASGVRLVPFTLDSTRMNWGISPKWTQSENHRMWSCASTGRAGPSLPGAGISTQLGCITHLVGSGLSHLP